MRNTKVDQAIKRRLKAGTMDLGGGINDTLNLANGGGNITINSSGDLTATPGSGIVGQITTPPTMPTSR